MILFDASPGQRLYLGTSGPSCGGGSVLDPSGATLSANQAGTFALGLTGTYTIFAPAAASGICTYTLNAPPADVTGQIAINGASVPATSTAQGQMIALTFTPTAGQNTTVSWTSNSIPGSEVFLLGPTGGTIAFAGAGTSGSLGSQFLGTAGTYTILVYSYNGGFGGISLNVTSP
jgi:hypothetical protein